MEFIDDKIIDYSLLHSELEDEVLVELQRETNLKVFSPRMLSGHLQGFWLTLLSKMLQPKLIVEIGTYTGYSAICLAKGLQENGKLITIDVNEETEAIAKKYFEKSGLSNRIELVTKDAKEVLPTINETIDMVFIDADKRNYSLYYDLVIDKVKSGGLIIADNVLWSGKILDLEKNKDVDTQAIQAFNEKMKNDLRVEKLLLPIRDGLFIMRKK
ncbi:MAG: O-methyltransferase [Bacteroidetes bacterium]|nr:O-methyltransferase [Bacteroidota bacterium]